jgi:hypothetical protein
MGNQTTNGIEKHIENFLEKDKLFGLVNVKILHLNI